MNDTRRIKDLLYEQVARIGKAAGSPKRLELIELLCQGEKTVDTLARETSISMKLASAHLRELRAAHLVETERQGKNVIYRIANRAVAEFWVAIRSLAEDRLVELHRCGALHAFGLVEPDDQLIALLGLLQARHDGAGPTEGL